VLPIREERRGEVRVAEVERSLMLDTVEHLQRLVLPRGEERRGFGESTC
jgi:hypothetical protein